MRNVFCVFPVLWAGGLFSVAAPAAAQQGAGPVGELATADVQSRLDQLQKLVEQQQQRIEKLQGELNAAKAADQSAVRTEEIRKVVREVMADAEFRESLYPDVTQVGYDHGFYIKSSDEAFLLNIQGLLAIRYIGTERQNENPRVAGRQKQDDINAFEISKLYLTFAGHLYTEKLTYQVTVKGDAVYSDNGTTYYAFVNYEIVKEFQIQAGLMDMPQGRQFLIWDSQQQFVDRGVAEDVFALGQSVGVMAHGDLGKRLTYMVGAFNGVADPWDSPTLGQLDTDFAYAARLVGHLLGEGISSEMDLAYSKDPLLDVAASFYYNDDNGDRLGPALLYSIPERIRSGRGIGGNAVVDSRGTEYFGFGADVAFRYRGFSITAEWYLRDVESDSRYSNWALFTTRRGPSHLQGGYIQAGYFIVPKKVEVAARMGGVWDNWNDNTWEYAFGANYYPFGSNNFKIQADFTHIDEASVTSQWINMNQNDHIDMFRVQLMVGFE
jgi:hypothetical protein